MFYHGTTDALQIRAVLLPPMIHGNKREEWRTKYTDVVFFTTSKLSARMYAKKACKKFGGNPVVYVVRPKGQWFNTVNNEYIARKARIVGVAEWRD